MICNEYLKTCFGLSENNIYGRDILDRCFEISLVPHVPVINILKLQLGDVLTFVIEWAGETGKATKML